MGKGERSWGVVGLAVFLTVVLCAAILPVAPVSANGTTVGMVVTPTPKTVTVNDTFSVNITVTISGGEAVNTAEAHINFNTTYLEVVSITAGNVLPTPLKSTFNNTVGTIDYAAGAQLGGVAPTTDFVLATLNLKAKAVTNATLLTFVYQTPLRNTIAVVGPYDVLSHAAVLDGSVKVLPLGSLSGHLELQGRGVAPNATWITAATVVFFQPGTSTVVRTANVTTDNMGNFTVANVTTGIYDIGVRCLRSLSVLVSNVTFAAATATSVTFGPMREGDANNDDAITGADYSYLYNLFGVTSGTALDYCDFNRDGAVTGQDYALLWMNYGQKGGMWGKWS